MNNQKNSSHRGMKFLCNALFSRSTILIIFSHQIIPTYVSEWSLLDHIYLRSSAFDVITNDCLQMIHFPSWVAHSHFDFHSVREPTFSFQIHFWKDFIYQNIWITSHLSGVPDGAARQKTHSGVCNYSGWVILALDHLLAGIFVQHLAC